MDQGLIIALGVIAGATLTAILIRTVALAVVRRGFKEQLTRGNELPYRDRAWMLNGGILANLICGSAILGTSQAITGHWLIASVFCGLAATCWFARRMVAAYVLPALGLPVLGLITWYEVKSLTSGPLKMPNIFIFDVGTSNMLAVMVVAGLDSLVLAIILMVPLFVSDNGKVFNILVMRRLGSKASTVYRVVSFVLLIGYSVLTVGTAAVNFSAT